MLHLVMLTAALSGVAHSSNRTLTTSTCTNSQTNSQTIPISYSMMQASDASDMLARSYSMSVSTDMSTVTRTFTPTPDSDPHLYPYIPAPVPAVVVASRQLQGVSGAVVAVTAVASTSGGQLGVANGIIRMASCVDDDDDDEPPPILVHPLRFTFGNTVSLRNAAGAISNTLFVPMIVSMIYLGPLRLLIMRTRSVPSRRAMVQMGWPSLLVLPFSNLAEGIGVTTMKALSSGEPFGVGIGAIALLTLLTFMGSWLWVLFRVMPQSRMRLRAEEKERGDTLLARLRWLIEPSHEWVPLPSQGVSGTTIRQIDVDRFSNTVGDKRIYYAEFLSFVFSAIVGICEGLPATLCGGRILAALVPAVLQCVLAFSSLVPIERYLQSLLALTLVPLYVIVVVKLFGDPFENHPDYDSLRDTITALSMIGNILGMVIMALGLTMSLLTFFSWSNNATKATAKRPHENGSARRSFDLHNLSLDSLDVPMLPIEAESKEDTANPAALEGEDSAARSDEDGGVKPKFRASTREPEPTAPAEPVRRPQRERTVAEILDFVESVAIQRRLNQTVSSADVEL